jgi:hypothetical protein
MRIFKFAVAILGAVSLMLPTSVSAAQKKAHAAYGKPTGGSKANVNRAKPSGGQAHQGGNRQGAGNANRQGGGNQQVNRNNAKKKGGNNVVAGNTVVVNGGGAGHGYYDNGNYHNRPDWDDDDDDFLEFVGKTAAITAGVSVVSAVIGSVVNDKPSGCQPVNANGTTYQYCNGTYYQQVPNGYQVVGPPQ